MRWLIVGFIAAGAIAAVISIGMRPGSGDGEDGELSARVGCAAVLLATVGMIAAVVWGIP